jgi:serine/threonine protein kinase
VNLPPRLGPYAILERLGVGGMAEVHLARRFGASGWEKLVALKTLRPERRGEPELERMLVAEARIAAMFAHPGLIGVMTSASPTASTTCAWTTSTGPTSRRC